MLYRCKINHSSLIHPGYRDEKLQRHIDKQITIISGLLIHGTKRRKYNQLESIELPCRKS